MTFECAVFLLGELTCFSRVDTTTIRVGEGSWVMVPQCGNFLARYDLVS